MIRQCVRNAASHFQELRIAIPVEPMRPPETGRADNSSLKTRANY
jgi:hypothetical protein